MTAEIGILNRTCVVLASDSAASIGTTVYQNATKLFDLGPENQMGMMIYNLSYWMEIPFEILVNDFLQSSKGVEFNNVEEVATEFVCFLKSDFSRHVAGATQNEFIVRRLHDLLDRIRDFTYNDLDGASAEGRSTDDILETTFLEVLDDCCKVNESYEVMPDFSDYSLQDFKDDFRALINKVLPGFYASFGVPRKAKYTNRIFKALYHEVIYKIEDPEDYCGVVIAGYGQQEIFPSIVSIKLGEIISGRLRYNNPYVNGITESRNVIVQPFAQIDMVQTFFEGMDPELVKALAVTLDGELKSLKEKVTTKFGIANSEINSFFSTALMGVLRKFREDCMKMHTDPIVDTIKHMRNEDVIEIAESLINLTSLKRKASNKMQSVGGPTDIAIITKANGFCWVKRKEFYNKLIASKVPIHEGV